MYVEDWAGIYKFARLGVLALGLVAIALYVYAPKRRERWRNARELGMLVVHPDLEVEERPLTSFDSVREALIA